MSYLVLARKYRPQTFDEIVGQEHVTQTLKNAIAQGRLHHAFLFTGARGVGKTTAARILAKALSCEKAPTPTPCNECQACREITQGSSVDVQEIDAASNNGVDNIRELRDAIHYAPVRGKKKVYILDEVHMLSSGAWNALLKTLEEPPPHAIFVFATTDPHKLPATILSRVQRYDFKLVATRRIVEHLSMILEREELKYEPGALTLVARESGGSVRDSLSLLDQVLAAGGLEGLTESKTAELLGVADRALLVGLGRAVLTRSAADALSYVDAAFHRGYDLVQLCHAFLGHLRDLVVAQAVSDPSALIEASGGELEELKADAAKTPAGLLELLFDRFCRIAEEVARSPVPKQVLEVGLLSLTRVEPLEPLSGLLDKLEALESRLERGGTRALAPPSTLDHQPSTINHQPSTLDPRPSTLDPRPSTINHQPSTLDPRPSTIDHRPSTIDYRISFPSLIEAVLAKEPRLSTLAQSRLLSRDSTKLTLGFDGEFAAEGLRERLPLLLSTLKTLTGEALSIDIVVGVFEKPTETLLEVEQRREDGDRSRRRSEALEHPVRKMLDHHFGGIWKDPVVDNLEKES
jgi:DNA polymerase-3 subunit gamma/tau